MVDDGIGYGLMRVVAEIDDVLYDNSYGDHRAA